MDINKKAVPSQGEPRDAAVDFDTCQILQEVDNRTFTHDNLVDADASGAKSGTKYLESRLEVIQGHGFWEWITEKPMRACILLYNNMGFRVGNFEGKV